MDEHTGARKQRLSSTHTIQIVEDGDENDMPLCRWSCPNCRCHVDQDIDMQTNHLVCHGCGIDWVLMTDSKYHPQPRIVFEPLRYTAYYDYQWLCPVCGTWESMVGDVEAPNKIRCEACKTKWKKVREGMRAEEGWYALSTSRLELLLEIV